MQNTRRMGVQHLVAFHLFKGWQQDIGFSTASTRGRTVIALASVFRRDRFVIRARQDPRHRMGNSIDLPGVSRRGVDAAQPGSAS